MTAAATMNRFKGEAPPVCFDDSAHGAVTRSARALRATIQDRPLETGTEGETISAGRGFAARHE